MTTVLLLGASGYLGRHVDLALRGAGVGVVAAGRARCDLLRASTADLVALLREVRPDAVVNCTGRLDGTLEELTEANTVVTARLLQALEDAPARYVRLGSAGEYGRVPAGTSAHEESGPAPVGPYGASHLAATLMVERARASGRVEGTTLRVFNPVGAGLKGDTVLGRAARDLAAAVATGAPQVHLGPLGAFRDFVDARDVADAVVTTAVHGCAWGVVNVGSGRATQVRDAVLRLGDLAGFTGEVVESGGGAARSAGVGWVRADVERARLALDWRPRRSLTESLQQVWADVAHPDGAGHAPDRTTSPITTPAHARTTERTPR